jgi:predicted outer membrane repeat protein
MAPRHGAPWLLALLLAAAGAAAAAAAAAAAGGPQQDPDAALWAEFEDTGGGSGSSVTSSGDGSDSGWGAGAQPAPAAAPPPPPPPPPRKRSRWEAADPSRMWFPDAAVAVAMGGYTSYPRGWAPDDRADAEARFGSAEWRRRSLRALTRALRKKATGANGTEPVVREFSPRAKGGRATGACRRGATLAVVPRAQTRAARPTQPPLLPAGVSDCSDLQTAVQSFSKDALVYGQRRSGGLERTVELSCGGSFLCSSNIFPLTVYGAGRLTLSAARGCRRGKSRPRVKFSGTLPDEFEPSPIIQVGRVDLDGGRSRASVVVRGVILDGANAKARVFGGINSEGSKGITLVTADIVNCVNDTECGGGVRAIDTPVTITGGRLENNQATSGAGGAVCAENGAVTITGGAEFVGNTASAGGGAISATNLTLRVYRAKFTRNTATEGGGALLFTSAEGGKVSIGGRTSFDQNSAAQGGALFVQKTMSDRDLSVSCLGCVFKNNGAGQCSVLRSDRQETSTNSTLVLTLTGSKFQGGRGRCGGAVRGGAAPPALAACAGLSRLAAQPATSPAAHFPLLFPPIAAPPQATTPTTTTTTS